MYMMEIDENEVGVKPMNCPHMPLFTNPHLILQRPTFKISGFWKTSQIRKDLELPMV